MTTNAASEIGANIADNDINVASPTPAEFLALKKEMLRHIRSMEQLFYKLYVMFKREIAFQLKLIDNLWINTMHLNSAQQKRRSSKDKFKGISEDEEKLIYLTNHEIKQLQESNAKLMKSTKPLYLSIKILDDYTSRLTLGPDANFIAEPKSNKPLSYFAESLINFYQYFSKCIRRMNYRTNEYKFNDEATIKEYRNLIQPSLETEHKLLTAIASCKEINADCIE